MGDAGEPVWMQSLQEVAGVTTERFERARAARAQALRATFESFVDEVAVRTVMLPGYESLSVDRVRRNAHGGHLSILATLEGGADDLYAQAIHRVAYLRASEGLPVIAIAGIIMLAEIMLGELALSCLAEREDQLAGFLVARTICDEARDVVRAAFQKSLDDSMATIEQLSRQFSAPILPALPGVLVLPIVGAIGPKRADQIVTALLDGVVEHTAHTVILDFTGLTEVSAELGRHLRRMTDSAQLLGARTVLVGIQADVARVLIQSGADLTRTPIAKNLASGLLTASRQSVAVR